MAASITLYPDGTLAVQNYHRRTQRAIARIRQDARLWQDSE